MIFPERVSHLLKVTQLAVAKIRFVLTKPGRATQTLYCAVEIEQPPLFPISQCPFQLKLRHIATECLLFGPAASHPRDQLKILREQF